MVLMVAGLVLAPVLAAYNIQRHQNKENVTEINLNAVTNAVNKFVTLNARYPRPASLSDEQGDPAYGLEGPEAPTPCTEADWFATDGMCVTENAVPVLIGAVPFDVIGLNSDKALDYWNNKLLYAVTLRQTSAETYVESAPSAYGGSIEIKALENADTITGGQLVTVTDSLGDDELYDMIVLSHGEQGVGAISTDGVPVLDCRSPAQEFEDENCDMDEVFIVSRHPRRNDARPALYSLGEGNGRYYDDYTKQQVTPAKGTWSVPKEADPSQPVVWAGASQIGIGTEDPRAKLHVEGNILIDNKLRTSKFCNNNDDCFSAELLVGNDAAMNCNASNPDFTNRPVVKVEKNRVYCATIIVGSDAVDGEAYKFDENIFQSRDCKEDEGNKYVRGFDASGRPECTP